MTQINDPANLGIDLFGYKIKYNQVDGHENPNTDFMDLKVKPKFNGNIAEVDWRTATEDNEPLKRYGYVYDSLNRLSAGFYQKEGSETSKEYFERMEYDRNGNITRLQRSAGLLSGSTIALGIDNLKYDYSGNRLNKVTEEQIGNSNGYPYLTNHNVITYDDNGNMISHKDKGINSILYNYLNLPSTVISGSGRRASSSLYIYRADGTKLKKILTNSLAMSSTEIDYLDGFQYDNKIDFCIGCPSSPAILKFVPTSEGYFDFEKNLYIYNYTDHLGNVRLSYADSDYDGGILPRDMNSKYCEDMGDGNMACYDVWMPGEVVEVNNYYPFGLMHNYTATTMNSYQYKYNGKELQETGMYDYGARFYMPDIGRWGVVDPLAEKDKRWTPYRYAYDNPLRFIDPDGRNEELVITGQDADAAVKELNDESALKLSRNSKTGKVDIDNKSKIKYKNLSAVDKKLYDIIESTNKTVNLSTTRDMVRNNPSGGQSPFLIGAFNGQTSTKTSPEVNVIQSQGLENSGGQSVSTSIRHEIFESFIAVELAQSFDLLRSAGAVVPNSSSINFYLPAHNAAKSLDPSFNFSPQNNQLYLQQDPGKSPILWYNPNTNANLNSSSGWVILQQ